MLRRLYKGSYIHFGHNIEKECRAVIILILRNNFPLLHNLVQCLIACYFCILDIVLERKTSNEENTPINIVGSILLRSCNVNSHSPILTCTNKFSDA